MTREKLTLNQKAAQTEFPKKSRPRWKFYLILIMALLVVSVGFVLWAKDTWTLRRKAKEQLDTYEKVQSELTRCSLYLSGPGGDFSEYEYCKKFIRIFKVE